MRQIKPQPSWYEARPALLLLLAGVAALGGLASAWIFPEDVAVSRTVSTLAALGVVAVIINYAKTREAAEDLNRPGISGD